jgi:hypothetical protein
VTSLKHPVTGHEITTDGESVNFWKGAGYRESEQEKPARKTAAKKAASKKSE